MVGQPVVELLCDNLGTLINRFKTVIFTYGDVEVTATEGPTSCTALINRVLIEKNPPSPLVITRCEIKYCGKITDSFFSLCLLMLFLCTWWLTTKDLLDKCSTSLGIIFQMGNDNVNLILPLQISSFIYCHVLAYSLLRLFTAVK